ncbi:transposase [Mesorhizobium sp.]|uniref:transposase n=1 Tax=Mesorhizobium sp. TaxID=1871066 RepID=UPI000FE5B490|nr:MAG: hypothetical protein EOR01_26480 [Mesorhizobium sp.]RWP94447.1 MAG: hypothetical protein EOR89_30085 [Mesorhizobium sp.]RWQ26557.1 MAG: hypothetical protein EOS19_24765 [Mesorhizobium sp.]RWQ44058.1 MAG: hypothetical protein EOS82_28305 [Mesorhizobium sp.]RWQ47075.1 MAG: hypothetical protein EOS83_28250 [Mesorhizobium sp.]
MAVARSAKRRLNQVELQLEELEADASGGGDGGAVVDCPGLRAQAPNAQAFPEHLPRERVVIAAQELPVLRFSQAGEAWRGCHRDVAALAQQAATRATCR